MNDATLHGGDHRLGAVGHAELRQDGTAYWIVDLGSTNGLEVNGKRTDRARMRDGDRITIGSTEIVFGRSLPS